MLAWTGKADWSAPLAYAAVFVGALILLSVVASMIGGVVRGSMLGGIDRTLGVVFGLVRGAALVVVAYIAAGFVVTHWPEPVLQARARPFVAEGAAWLVAQIPPQYRPTLPNLPPGQETSAAALSRGPVPQGSATDHKRPEQK
jgi:membrane protein required for colicin V production